MVMPVFLSQRSADRFKSAFEIRLHAHCSTGGSIKAYTRDVADGV
jgi:hypothetical protein